MTSKFNLGGPKIVAKNHHVAKNNVTLSNFMPKHIIHIQIYRYKRKTHIYFNIIHPNLLYHSFYPILQCNKDILNNVHMALS